MPKLKMSCVLAISLPQKTSNFLKNLFFFFVVHIHTLTSLQEKNSMTVIQKKLDDVDLRRPLRALDHNRAVMSQNTC